MKPNVTWILVANRAGAKLFASPHADGRVGLLQVIDHPEGRRQNREIDTDGKGSRYSATTGTAASHASGPSNHQKHGLDPQEEASEHITNIFAHELDRILRDGRTRNQFESLILVAEPGFLGKLRTYLDKETANRVIATHNRNLVDLADRELLPQLEDLVIANRKIA